MNGLKEFAVGFGIASVLYLTIIGIMSINFVRQFREIEDKAFSSCENARERASEFGKERNKLWMEISRLKRR